jgi:hypothetical protein
MVETQAHVYEGEERIKGEFMLNGCVDLNWLN